MEVEGPGMNRRYIELTFEFKQEADQWAGLCKELGTASCGDSLDEAHEALREMVVLHLNSLEEVGERANFFSKHGIHVQRGKPKNSAPVPVLLGRLVQRVVEPVPPLETVAV